MADTTVSLGFKSKEFTSEIKNITTSLKSAQKEFKATDAVLKNNGTKLEQLENKQKSYSNQLKLNQQLQAKYKQVVTQASDAQEKAKARLEKANKAYEDGKKSLKGNSDELKKLKDEVTKSEKAVNTATTQYEKYNNKLKDSKVSEANMQVELKKTSKELQTQQKYITQVKDKYAELQKKTSGLRNGMSAVGSAMTKGVTLPVIAGATASVAAFKDVDEGADTIISKTGATGKAAEDLEKIYKNVATTMPQDFSDIGAAIGEINTRLGFTGQQLQNSSVDFLKFAEINGTDVNTSVQLVSRAMGDAGIQAGNYKNLLDMLTVASQKSGIGIDTLSTNLAKYGAPMRALGIDTKNAIALFAAWEKAGVNTEIAFSGMKKAISNWGKAGKDSSKEFAKTMKQIKNTPTLAAATTKAIEAFGAKAGPDLADAIKGGRFEVEKYMDALNNAANSVSDTYSSMEDDDVKFTLAMHNVKIALSEMGQTLLTTAAPVIQDLSNVIKDGAKAFDGMSESQKNNVLKWLALAAAIGPTLSLASKSITVFNGIASGVSVLSGVIGTASSTAGLTAAIGAIAPALGVATLAFSPILVGMGLAQKDAKKTRDEMVHFGDAIDSSFKKLDEVSKKKTNTDKLIKEYEDLKLKIQSNKLSTDDLTSAKERLSKIEDILIEKNPDILSTYDKENGKIDDGIAKLKEKNKLEYESEKWKAKNVAKEAYDKLPTQLENIKSTENSAEQYKNQLSLAERSYNTLLKLKHQYDEVINNTSLSSTEKTAKLQDILKKANDAGNYVGANINNVKNLGKATEDASEYLQGLRNDAINCNNDLSAAYKTTQVAYNNIKKSVELDLGSSFEKATNDLTWYNNQMKELEKNGKKNTTEYIDLKNAFDKLSPKVGKAAKKISELNGTIGDTPGIKKIDVEALTKDAGIKLDTTKKKADNLPKEKQISVYADTSQANYKLDNLADKLLGLTRAPYKVKTIEETVLKTTYENGLPTISGHAKGTSNASAGLSVVNEEGPELIEKPNGQFYIAKGTPALIDLGAGDKVYTAQQTKRMYNELPHFADGKSAYENAKNTFDHRKATSDMSLQEQITWWQNVLKEFAYDTDAVKEAQEEIYSLTKELSDKQNEDFKTNLDKQLELSKKYIDDCLYSANWGTDSIEKAFERVNDRYKKALADGKITIDEYNNAVSGLKETISSNSKEYSQSWLENMSKYGLINDSQYVQGLQRMLDNEKELYKQGIIDYRTYADECNDITGQIYDKRLSIATDYINNYYDSIDKAEEAKERSDNLSDLKDQEKMYAGAVTKDGKEKLKSIREQISNLKKEQEKDDREQEKEEDLKRAKKYVAQISGIYGSANEESAKAFDNLISQASAQQVEIAQNGYELVKRIVASTKAQMAEINTMLGNTTVNSNITTNSNNTIQQYQTIHNTINDNVDADMFGRAAAHTFRLYANPYLLK